MEHELVALTERAGKESLEEEVRVRDIMSAKDTWEVVPLFWFLSDAFP
jgi:hypothetical protein